MRQASAQFTLPNDARTTNAGWRWRASVRVDRLKYAPVECEVVVLPATNANEPSPDAITLDTATTATAWPTQHAPGTAPHGAHELINEITERMLHYRHEDNAVDHSKRL